MTFIYFLISIVLFYYLFKFGARLLLPFFFRKMAEKMMNGRQGEFAQDQPGANPFERRSQASRPDGKVRVEYMPPKQTKKKAGKGANTAGEFIDFEEVK
ncbi:MAG: DUF4834 family protein [Sphingobacterium sp.]